MGNLTPSNIPSKYGSNDHDLPDQNCLAAECRDLCRPPFCGLGRPSRQPLGLEKTGQPETGGLLHQQQSIQTEAVDLRQSWSLLPSPARDHSSVPWPTVGDHCRAATRQYGRTVARPFCPRPEVVVHVERVLGHAVVGASSLRWSVVSSASQEVRTPTVELRTKS